VRPIAAVKDAAHSRTGRKLPVPRSRGQLKADILEQTRQAFSLSGWILRALPDRADRELLSRRIVAKLSGLRRGRLYLPSHFPQEVQALSELRTTQLRQQAYWLKANAPHRYYTNSLVATYVHRVMPETIRTVSGDLSVHVRQSAKVKPLQKSQWPRLGTRPLWPSSPTVDELFEMGRRGETPVPISKRTRVKHGISWAHFNSNAEMRRQIVHQGILGIRSDIEVPEKYLGYFRYRWSMLILTGRYLPTGLVRFLAGQWIRNPHNLWLTEKINLSNLLRSTDYTTFRCVVPGPW